jgi:transcriptional accessory protein Tex/SPT6
MFAQVGVDINMAASNQWMAPPLQFVAGLGPRKARALLQVHRAESATPRMVVCIMSSAERTQL